MSVADQTQSPLAGARSAPAPLLAVSSTTGETGDRLTTVFRVWRTEDAAACPRCPRCDAIPVHGEPLAVCLLSFHADVSNGKLDGLIPIEEAGRTLSS